MNAKCFYVVKDEQSGIYRLTDVLKEGEESAYMSTDPRKVGYMAHHLTSKGSVKCSVPAVDGKGRDIKPHCLSVPYMRKK